MSNSLCGLKLLLADDHMAVRDSIKQLFLQADVNVVAEAGDGVEAVRLCREAMADVAVLDISMPRMNGIDATREIRRYDPCVCVILLTMHSAEAYLRAGLSAGASALVSKTEPFSRLLDAIGSAIEGRLRTVGRYTSK
jgi:two-component system, NarL family, response regulator LiaR